jgi:hypothetical protein
MTNWGRKPLTWISMSPLGCSSSFTVRPDSTATPLQPLDCHAPLAMTGLGLDCHAPLAMTSARK